MADHLHDASVSVARRMARCYVVWRTSLFTRIHFLRSVLIVLLFSAIPGLSFSMSTPSYAEITAVSSAVELIAAINAANVTAAPDLITLTADIALTAIDNDSNGLPPIISAITIQGNRHTIQRDPDPSTPEFGILWVREQGDLTLIDTTIRNGIRSQGGGINNEGTLTVINCRFYDNTALEEGPTSRAAGGAIAGNSLSMTTVINSTFSGNHSIGDDSWGGAVAINFHSHVDVIGSTFTDNHASIGGAISTSSASLGTITNSTITGNTASGGPNIAGGGFAGSGRITITNSTIAGNAAIGDNAYAGGIYAHEELTLINTIVANNDAPLDENCHIEATVGLETTHNLEYGTSGQCPGVTQTGDPMLGTLGDYGGPTQTLAILSVASPAIDNADPALCPPTDQRYYSRVNVCDIGAYEYQGLAFLIPPGLTKVFEPDTISAGGTSTLTLTLNNSSVIPLTSVYFSDILPVGLSVSGPGTTSCGTGAIDASIGNSVINARALTIPAHGSCVLTVPVTSAIPGTHTNTVDNVFAAETGTTALQRVTAALTVATEPQIPPSYATFDPAISKTGVLQPGGLGLPGETITWQITVMGGGIAAYDVVLTDPFPTELSIDSVTTNKGSYGISGQIVTVAVGDLAPGEIVQMTIQTVVPSGPSGGVFTNTATLTGGGVTKSATAIVSVVTELPSTGYPSP
jgi:uncharacterized repeat protein (TIGR01451 family)